ncbi:MAG: FAD-dependent thymidylate synthase, partial [Anaplasmataceae bacterium]|nr:FAD-dependent thymidylate synthase [Anaplasmataceae bacterium]
QQSTLNKQVSEGEFDSQEEIELIKEKINNVNSYCLAEYNDLIDRGLARETARIVVPTSIYTEWYWKIDLHNLLHFIKLRISSHAQYEIREYANALNDILKLWVPFTHKAFNDFVLNSYSITDHEKELLKRIFNGEKVDQENSGLSKRNWLKFKNWWNNNQ